MRRKKEQRTAVTLIELLVVVSIIGLLVSLLLLAVHAARESSRSAYCSNNLKQIQLAVSNYEASYRCYPQSRNDSGGFLVSVLPFLEKIDVANEIASYQLSVVGPPPRPKFTIVMPMYLCPSDAVKHWDPVAASNYCGNSGAWAGETRTFDGIFRGFDDIGFGAGIVRPADVTDGTSNTDCLSEWLRASGRYDRQRTAWNTPDKYRDRQLFTKTCRSLPSDPNSVGWEGNSNCKGTPWIDGNVMVTLFNHVSVPNTPSCFNRSGVPNGAATVTSNHRGGVWVTFADGHLQFIGNEIDAEVWFSFGSRDGGTVLSSAN